MSRRPHGPALVADVVARFLSTRDESGRRNAEALALKVFEAFRRVGPPVTDHAEPSLFRRGVITLDVDSSSWLTELGFLKAELIGRINKLLGREAVKDVRLRLGNLRRTPPPKPPPPLTPRQEEQIESWVEGVADPELRALVRRAAEANLRRQSRLR